MEEQDFDTFMVVLRGLVDSYEADIRQAIASGEQDASMEEADWLEQFEEFIGEDPDDDNDDDEDEAGEAA